MRLYGYTVMRLYGCEVVGLCGYRIFNIVRLSDSEVICNRKTE